MKKVINDRNSKSSRDEAPSS